MNIDTWPERWRTHHDLKIQILYLLQVIFSVSFGYFARQYSFSPVISVNTSLVAKFETKWACALANSANH